jgi:hypothetical protein
MSYLDQALAWMIFTGGVVQMLITEITHWPGAVLDPGLIWIFVAMFNFLRIRNDGSVRGLNSTCIAANVCALMFEILRAKMYPSLWGAMGILIFGETIFSLRKSLAAH